MVEIAKMYAEVFPPGDFLKEELQARNWTQQDLTKILGKSSRLVNEIINAKRAITPETAKGLAAAFGTSAQYWMESLWQLFQLGHSEGDIARRAKLYSRFPMNELIKRNWIENSDSLDVLESQICNFYGHPDNDLKLVANFRRSGEDETIQPLQLAWQCRAYNLARKLVVSKFNNKSLSLCLERLRPLLTEPEEVRHVPRILAESGIRFLIIEQIKGSKVDGACMWLDGDSPVIAMSLRYGRIDWFWFTLFHEIRHVANRDNAVIDIDLMESDPNSDVESRADSDAAEFLIPESEMDNFIARIAPIYSFSKVLGFSRRMQVHPGIVVGRLQHRGEIPFSHFTKLLVDIRNTIIPNAITDGWGYIPA